VASNLQPTIYFSAGSLKSGDTRTRPQSSSCLGFRIAALQFCNDLCSVRGKNLHASALSRSPSWLSTLTSSPPHLLSPPNGIVDLEPKHALLCVWILARAHVHLCQSASQLLLAAPPTEGNVLHHHKGTLAARKNPVVEHLGDSQRVGF
jgi:hypothetical protein